MGNFALSRIGLRSGMDYLNIPELKQTINSADLSADLDFMFKVPSLPFFEFPRIVLGFNGGGLIAKDESRGQFFGKLGLDWSAMWRGNIDPVPRIRFTTNFIAGAQKFQGRENLDYFLGAELVLGVPKFIDGFSGPGNKDPYTLPQTPQLDVILNLKSFPDMHDALAISLGLRVTWSTWDMGRGIAWLFY